MIIRLVVVQIGKMLLNEIPLNTLYEMNQYFPKPYDRFGGNVKVELDLSNNKS